MFPLQANLVHVQTLRASVGKSVEVFTLRRSTTRTPLDTISDSKRTRTLDEPKKSKPKSKDSKPPPPPDPSPPRPDKLTRGRATRRRRGDADSPSAERTPPQSRPLPDPPTSVLASVRNELEATQAELSRSQLDYAKLADRCKLLERAVREASDLILTREREIDDLKKDRERLIADRARADRDARLKAPDRDRRRPTTTPSRASSSTTAYDSDYDDSPAARVRSPLARRNRSQPPVPRPAPPNPPDPLPALDLFLTKTDRWSGAQVIEAVQDLNSEILQLAAAATEITAVRGPKAPLPRLNQARRAIMARLGPAFSHVLATRDHSHDPTLVQFALQACIAACTARLLSAFCIGLPMMPNELFSQLYDHVHETEPQATSSRWRALTLAHIRSLNPQLEDMAANEFVVQILRAWAEVFILCGCTSPDVALASLDALRARFGRQLQRIAHGACNLARVVKEQIMSTNFDVLFVDQGTPFAAAEMTNAYAGYGGARGPVLCTTELGLQCVTRKRMKPGADADETVERMLLPPKVILESVAQVLDHLPEPSV
ncbi:hypothetical protein OF83DRAFT_298888 [Amylostereum chailletii]|nr:hypothetical protein OF83DRAFT_298888 [Amylostereum chailletii]